MPRPLRIWFPGALYHLIVRGNNREPIFFERQDYRVYLKMLKEAVERYESRLLAYALMGNHVHLMVQTEQQPVSKFMQSMSTAYAVYVNRKYKRVGHVFQGRYHSVLVERDAYAMELTRYIHLNPVRAGLVPTPERYEWSSYRAYLGKGGEDFVDVELVLNLISQETSHQHRLYAQFVDEGRDRIDHALERKLFRGQILGSPTFVSMALESKSSKSGSDPQYKTEPNSVFRV